MLACIHGWQAFILDCYICHVFLLVETIAAERNRKRSHIINMKCIFLVRTFVRTFLIPHSFRHHFICCFNAMCEYDYWQMLTNQFLNQEYDVDIPCIWCTLSFCLRYKSIRKIKQLHITQSMTLYLISCQFDTDCFATSSVRSRTGLGDNHCHMQLIFSKTRSRSSHIIQA